MTAGSRKLRPVADLAEQHAEFLSARAVPVVTAQAAGYQSVPAGESGRRRLTALGFSTAQTGAERVPGLLIPLVSAGGERWGWLYRPDSPRRSAGRRKDGAAPKLIKYESPPNQKPRLVVPPAVADWIDNRRMPLFVTEGPVKALAVAEAGWAVVGILGVGLWRTPDWDTIPLSDRTVFVGFDSDAATNPDVAGQLAKLSAFLRERGASVGICAIPASPDGDKVGVDDFLAAGGSLEELIGEATPEAPAVRPEATAPDGDGRPPLDVSNDARHFDWLHDNIGAGPLSGLFRRGSLLVRVPRVGEDGYIPPVKEEDDDGPAQVHPVDAATLRAIVARTFWTYKVTAKGLPVPTLPPPAAADLTTRVAEGAPNLRRLDGVVHAPVVRRDWSAVAEPGYDDATRLLYLPTGDLDLPTLADSPSPKLVARARDYLLDLVGDFPFVSESDRANYLGLLLTPALRVVTPGPWPLGVLNAPMRGSGKSLLGQVLREVWGGVLRSEPGADRDDELRKSITAILATTTGPVVQFDNVTGVIRSGQLAALLTSAEWSDRILGRSEMAVALPNDRLWIVTGNNVALAGDLGRRAVWVTIDPRTPRPWERAGFAIPDLAGHVRERRGDIIAASLTLVRAWAVAGEPADPFRSDGYARWAAVVRGVLKVGGVPGTFLDPRTDRAPVEAGEEEEWAAFLDALGRTFGDHSFTSAEVVAALSAGGLGGGNGERVRPGSIEPARAIGPEDLPMDLAEAISRHGANSPSFARSLGRWFSNRDGRYAGDLCARRAGQTRNGMARWKIEKG